MSPVSCRRPNSRAIVSLGSNVEPRADYLKRALAALAAIPGTRLVKASGVIETEPVGVPAEFAAMKFLNQVALFETDLDPFDFSRRMHAIEDDLGRVRTVRNGPRTIDIDLIDFGGQVIDTPELTLPHPRAHLRDFVCRPLAELGIVPPTLMPGASRPLRKFVLAFCAALTVRAAFAFIDPVTIGLASWFTTSIGLPVSYALGCAFAYSPGIRIFGTERAVYGLDWGSLACHAENVYGLQLSFVGGSVEEDLYGLQLGLIASGYAQEELPFDEWHLFNVDHCRVNGVQVGTFAAKTAMANGFQMSAVYTEARTVNGFQVGLVNTVWKLHGLQVGLYNEAKRGLGLQVGLVNLTNSGLVGFFPGLNFVF